MKITAILSFIFVFFVLFQSESAFSKTKQRNWRCGKKIVTVGDSKSSVLLKCGPPTVKDISESNTTGSFITKKQGDVSKGKYEDTTQIIEEWVYNCGSGHFITYLTFKGGKLVSIIIGEYGSGESYCNGADKNPNNKKD